MAQSIKPLSIFKESAKDFVEYVNKRLYNHRVIILLLTGIILILLQYPFGPYSQIIFLEFSPKLGTAIITSVIIAVLLGKLLNEAQNKKIEALMAACFERMYSNFILRDNARNIGLENVFSRQLDTSYNEFLYSKIKEQIDSKKGTIRMAGVAITDIFSTHSQNQNFENLFRKGWLNDQSNQCKMKVLVLNPNSKYAKFKHALERTHNTTGDIETTKNMLEELTTYDEQNRGTTKIGSDDLKRQRKQNRFEEQRRLQYKLYNWMPIALLYITDKWLFVEAYPNFETTDGDLNRPLGGRTPLLVIKADTIAYKRWVAHFEYLWEFPKFEVTIKKLSSPDSSSTTRT